MILSKIMLNLIQNYPFQYQDENYFYLYRHMSFEDYYVSGIKNATLYFSSPANFNDPFDSSFALAEQPTKDFHKKILKNLGVQANPAQQILNRKKSQKLLDQSFREGSFFEERFKKVGIICLNHHPLSILMWSHYANYHKGFLIELKFPKDSKKLESLDYLPFPVTYSAEFPRGNIDNFDEIQVYKMLYTKSQDWAYEHEFRILATGFKSTDDQLRIYEYPKSWLTSIILGCKTSKIDADRIRCAVNALTAKTNQKIKIYEAQKCLNSFALTVPNHPRLDVLGKSKRKKK